MRVEMRAAGLRLLLSGGNAGNRILGLSQDMGDPQKETFGVQAVIASG